VIRAQVELGKLEDELRSLRGMQEPVVAKLNAALNRAPDAPLPWPKQLPEPTTALTTSAELVAWLTQGNPELRTLDFAVAKATAAVSLARRDRYPDLMLGVKYDEMSDAAMSGASDDGGDTDEVMAMLSINVPLWAGKYNAGVREARARLASARAERQEKEQRLVAELKMAWFGFSDAERKVVLYRDTLIPQATQGLEVARQAFAAGNADFLDLIDAQRVLLEFQLMHERARADRAQRLAELEMLVGRSLSPAGPDASAEPKPDQAALESEEAH
jgi:cobalt-zinc-cadmium efflux system outer membrane protein